MKSIFVAVQAVLCGFGAFYAVDALMPTMPAFFQGMVCAAVGYGSLIFTSYHVPGDE